MRCSRASFARRASCNAAVLEIAQKAPLCRIVEHDPGDQCGDHESGYRIGGDDEIGVRPQIHGCASAKSCACIKRMLRTRRRKISLRMTARCNVMNKRVKASAMINSGLSNAASMVDPPIRNTEAGWCSGFHQSAENLMIRELTAPTNARIARDCGPLTAAY